VPAARIIHMHTHMNTNGTRARSLHGAPDAPLGRALHLLRRGHAAAPERKGEPEGGGLRPRWGTALSSSSSSSSGSASASSTSSAIASSSASRRSSSSGRGCPHGRQCGRGRGGGQWGQRPARAGRALAPRAGVARPADHRACGGHGGLGRGTGWVVLPVVLWCCQGGVVRAVVPGRCCRGGGWCSCPCGLAAAAAAQAGAGSLHSAAGLLLPAGSLAPEWLSGVPSAACSHAPCLRARAHAALVISSCQQCCGPMSAQGTGALHLVQSGCHPQAERPTSTLPLAWTACPTSSNHRSPSGSCCCACRSCHPSTHPNHRSPAHVVSRHTSSAHTPTTGRQAAPAAVPAGAAYQPGPAHAGLPGALCGERAWLASCCVSTGSRCAADHGMAWNVPLLAPPPLSVCLPLSMPPPLLHAARGVCRLPKLRPPPSGLPYSIHHSAIRDGSGQC